jgi:hypothetical protein
VDHNFTLNRGRNAIDPAQCQGFVLVQASVIDVVDPHKHGGNNEQQQYGGCLDQSRRNQGENSSLFFGCQ